MDPGGDLPPDLRAAVSLHRAGRLAQAERAYRAAAAASPADARAWHLLGVLLQQAGRAAEAPGPLWRAVELDPSAVDARANLAAALGALGRHEEAADRLREALALRPAYPEAWQNLGVALERTGRAAEAVGAYRRAIVLRPAFAEAHNHLGNALRKLGRTVEAEACHRRALALRPDYPEALNNLGTVLAERGDLAGVIDCHRRSAELGGSPAAQSHLLVHLHYDPAQTPQSLLGEARRWDERHAAPLRRLWCPHENDRSPGRRLRVGYVSPDLRDHPVGRLMEPVLAGHDRSRVEVFCYSDAAEPVAGGGGGDAVTMHLRRLADVWRPTRGTSDDALAELIRRDGIDVLVETAGHFAGNRLTMMARRPAPVQVSGFGYCGTTGLSAIDYRLTDARSDPPGESGAFHSEQLVRLADCCWCYRPFEPTPEVGPVPALASGCVTFGNLNNLIKMTDEAVALWSRILRAVPGSRLLLLGKEAADEPVRGRFARHGVGTERIEWFRPAPRPQYLGAYSRIDVVLDPFPFNGDNSTCDALWMGAPVVSLVGRAFASRRGLSHLSALGLADLAVATEEEYVRRAVELASDLPRLAALRAGLRGRLLASPLADAARFARNLEAAYRRMWRRWCDANRRGETLDRGRVE